MTKSNVNPILASLLSEQVLHLAVAEDRSSEFVQNLIAQTNNAELMTETGRVNVFETAMLSTFGFRMQNTMLFNTVGSVAVIPIHGSTINRLNSYWGFVTGYNYIKAAVTQALNTKDVTAIVFDVNSHGGEVAGCFETAEFIKNATAVKPIHAIVDSNCHSAAYALVSGCTSITATPSASIGSIGVVAVHTSVEKMYENAGIKVTFIQAGKNKTLGNPYQDLTDDAKAQIQQRIDNSYKVFTSTVAENRNIDEKEVIKTEATCYNAKDALTIGLIDKVSTVEQAIQFLTNQTGAENMKDDKVQANAETQKPDNANVAMAERQRIQAIIGSEAANGKTSLAQHLAFNTSLSADEAVAILNAAQAETPKEEPKAEAPQEQQKVVNLLDDAMAKTGSPNVGADAAETGDESNIDDIASFANSFEV